MDPIDTTTMFEAIRDPFEAALHRHTANPGRDTISLDPYAMVPLDTYVELADEYQTHLQKWAKAGIDIQPIIRSVLLVDTATEANLPWYTAHIEHAFAPWHEWNARWTAEERSHEEIMLRDIESRGILDMSAEWLPVRERNMAAGIHVNTPNPAEGLAYVATQELATKVAHFGSARVLDDSGASNLRRIGSDEGRHYNFYVALLRAFGEEFPDEALIGMRQQHEGDTFAMPGKQGIAGYKTHAKNIALGGLFDPVTVLEAQRKTIEDARLLHIAPTTDEGKQAQLWAAAIADGSHEAWERKSTFMSRLRELSAKRADPSKLHPFILGHTVELAGTTFQPITA